MLHRTPGAGTYARVEREQRWLLSGLPEEATDPVEILDRYFTTSTLRLRRMRSGSDTVFKLGQKVRAAPGSPERVFLTNMYLTEHEFDLLDRVEGASLHKTRWHWSTGDDVLSVDEFTGRLGGLILAEIELTDDERYRAAPPLAIADVTGEDRFSGGRLAHLSVAAAGKLQASISELAQKRGRP